MSLPSPQDYSNWQDFASALIASLTDGTGGVAAESAEIANVNPPAGFQPVYWSDALQNLYTGNSFLTAPPIVAPFQVDTQSLALASVELGQIADGAVSTEKIVDLAVINAKIANATILSAKIGDLQVVTAKIDNLAVNTAKIADLAVNNAKIANLSVDQAKIALLAVGGANIIDAAINSAKIQDASIVGADIASATILTANIGLAQITTALIANLAVGSAQIAALAVISAKIGDLEVGTLKVAAAAITTPKIGDSQITTPKLPDAGVTTPKVDYGVAGVSSAFFDSANAPNLLSDSVWSNVGSVSLTSSQGMVIEGEFHAILTCTTGASTEVDFKIERDDGTSIISSLIISSRDEGESISVKWLDAVDAAHTSTWTAYMKRHSGSTNTTAVSNRFMKVTENVRQYYAAISLAAPAGQGPGRGTDGGGNINGGGHPLADNY